LASAKSFSLSRFHLSAEAELDLDDILTYLDQLPLEPGDRIAESLQGILESIGTQPLLGAPHSQLTRLLGQEVRSRLVPPYRIYYRLGKNIPEIIAILHGARDQTSILGNRFQ
jgi:plasmid stabilization system protein ParE